MKSAEEISIDILLGIYGMDERESESLQKYIFFGDNVRIIKNEIRDIEGDEIQFGEFYRNEGQAGIMGANGKVENNTFTQNNAQKEKGAWAKWLHPRIAIIVGLIAIFGFITGIRSCKEIIAKKSGSPIVSQPNTPSSTAQKELTQPNKP